MRPHVGAETSRLSSAQVGGAVRAGLGLLLLRLQLQLCFTRRSVLQNHTYENADRQNHEEDGEQSYINQADENSGRRATAEWILSKCMIYLF